MFKKTREKFIENLKANFEEYEHECGTKHYHLRSDNHENCFLVAFPTLPKNDDGRAHILEHLALCGSEKYPSGDPFFSMTRRSLATFMNAMTYPDKTIYPFSTIEKQDYFNLLSVYLDATFFPKLDYLNFRQEGWRYEFNEKNELEYQGVVYNEMKGALANKFSLIFKAIQKDLKPNTIYANQSGGDPVSIPNLTHQELLDFHKTHYHPSRATLMTFGDIDPKEIQDFFEKEVVSKIKTRYERIFPEKSNLVNGLQRTHHMMPCPQGEKDNEHMVVLSWLLGESESDIVNDYEIFSNMILSEGGKVHSALDSANFGRPSQMMGVASSMESTLHIGMEGLTRDEVQKAEELIMQEIKKVAEKGVSKNVIESTLDDIELGIKKGSSRGMPFGLGLLINSVPLATNGRDPLLSLDSEPILTAARKRFENKNYVKELAQKLLDGMLPCVISYFEPQEDYFEKIKNDEQARLKSIGQTLTAIEIETIKKESQALAELQSKDKNSDVFPCISPEDVNKEVKSSLPIKISEKQGHPTTGYIDIATNGISYVNVLFDLSHSKKENWKWVEFVSNIIQYMPSKTKNWKKAMEQRNLLCQNVDVSLDLINDIDSHNHGKVFFEFSGYQLDRKNHSLKEIFESLINDISFNDVKRLKTLVENEIAEFNQNLPNIGNSLAMTELKASFSFQGEFEKEVSGISYVKFLKEILNLLKSPIGQEEVISKMNNTFKEILSSPVVVFGSGNENVKNLLDLIQKDWKLTGVNNAKLKQNVYQKTEKEIIKKAIAADSNVNYCYSAYQALNFKNTDSVFLDLAAQLMTNNRLHTQLREKGGAYGAGASYNALSGVFVLSTYRDPGFEKTYKEFDNVLDWFMKYEFTEDQLREAKIGLLKNFDKPSMPQAESERNINLHMIGIDDKIRKERKNKIINASMKDIKKAVEDYLLNNIASSCAFVSKSAKKEAANINFDFAEVKELI